MPKDNIPMDIAAFGEQDRATGRTTRQVDAYVQELFRAKLPMGLRDHWEAGSNRQANRLLLERVQRRLWQESKKELAISWYGVVPFVSIKREPSA